MLNPDVLPEDRDAANHLIQNIQAWNRYIIVYRPSEADLAFVVRTGRLASLRVQGAGPYPGGAGPGGRGAGPGAQTPPAAQDPPGTQGPGRYPQGSGPGVGGGGEVGPPDDLLQVYTSGGGNDVHTMLWEHSQHDGLRGSQPLFQHLRDAVEATCNDADDGKGSH